MAQAAAAGDASERKPSKRSQTGGAETRLRAEGTKARKPYSPTALGEEGFVRTAERLRRDSAGRPGRRASAAAPKDTNE